MIALTGSISKAEARSAAFVAECRNVSHFRSVSQIVATPLETSATGRRTAETLIVKGPEATVAGERGKTARSA
jgi:hypothetical protein